MMCGGAFAIWFVVAPWVLAHEPTQPRVRSFVDGSGNIDPEVIT